MGGLYDAEMHEYYTTELERAYERWECIKENGCNDMFYDDGVNLNLVRTQILCWRWKLNKLYGGNKEQYPPVYFREVPPEAEKGFMVRPDEIRADAKKSLDTYMEDSNYKYLCSSVASLDERSRVSTGIEYVLGYVSGLIRAIQEDNLLVMRRHARGMIGYQKSFIRCADNVKRILEV